jgi:hypothetical protein
MPNQTLKALSTQLKSGSISATELASDYLTRIAASDLNAFISVDPELTLAQARAADASIASGTASEPTLARWFDPTAFAAAPNFNYGNSGLRILPADILRTVDFSLFKNFQIGETGRLQFRWEAFNLPNTPSFAAPNSTLDTAVVGRITATATAPRQMQVALKYTF